MRDPLEPKLDSPENAVKTVHLDYLSYPVPIPRDLTSQRMQLRGEPSRPSLPASGFDQTNDLQL